jgi:hypothetical protein
VDTPDGTVVEQHVHLPGRGRFRAEARVLTGDGRTESDPHAGARLPRIIAWRSGDTQVQGDIMVTDDPVEAVVIVEPVPDAALEISVGAMP